MLVQLALADRLHVYTAVEFLRAVGAVYELQVARGGEPVDELAIGRVGRTDKEQRRVRGALRLVCRAYADEEAVLQIGVGLRERDAEAGRVGQINALLALQRPALAGAVEKIEFPHQIASPNSLLTREMR